MYLAPDEKRHLIGSVLLTGVLLLVVFIAHFLGPGYAVAAGSVIIGIGVEVYQQIRNEGCSTWQDAALSSCIGVISGLSYELFRALLWT